MLRDYQMVSPSLEGLLSDSELAYDGLIRPPMMNRIHDRPSGRRTSKEGESEIMAENIEERKVMEGYFHDLYGVFMKRLSFFVVENEVNAEDTLKIQAMLQELIKVKTLLVS